MYKTIIAAAVLAVSGSANANIILDFTGISAGAQVQDYYNGGTDSRGERGTNYGVHFDSGTVAYNQFGAYLSGFAVATFSPTIATLNKDGFFYIGFLANRYHEDGDVFLTGDQFADHQFIPMTGNPHCFTLANCDPNQNGYIDPASTYGYTLESFGKANRLAFSTDQVDNIEFGATGRPADRVLYVPEPAGLALLGIGLLALVGLRKRKS